MWWVDSTGLDQGSGYGRMEADWDHGKILLDSHKHHGYKVGEVRTGSEWDTEKVFLIEL